MSSHFPYDKQVDMFSLGCLLFDCLARKSMARACKLQCSARELSALNQDEIDLILWQKYFRRSINLRLCGRKKILAFPYGMNLLEALEKISHRRNDLKKLEGNFLKLKEFFELEKNKYFSKFDELFILSALLQVKFWIFLFNKFKINPEKRFTADKLLDKYEYILAPQFENSQI